MTKERISYEIGRVWAQAEKALDMRHELTAWAVLSPRTVAQKAFEANIEIDTTDWPETLTDDEQADWWLGYYHKRSMMHQQLYGLREVADALEMDRNTLATWRDRGKLPEPDQQLAMGPVWLAETIEPWIMDRKLERMGVQITTYSDGGEHEYEAIQLPWSQVREILGRDHDGSPDDDELLIAALQSKGAPEWVADARGWIDEHGWGLIGPKTLTTGGLN